MNVLVLMGKNKPGMLRTIRGVDKQLQQRGFNFYYFLSGNKFMKGLDFNQSRVKRINHMSSLRIFPSVFIALLGLFKGKAAVNKWKIDIIYNYTLSTLPFCMLLSKLCNVPYVTAVRNAYEGDGRRYGKYLLHKAKNIIAVSQDTMNCVESFMGSRIKNVKKFIVYNAIDIKLFTHFLDAERPEEYKTFKEEDLVIGMVAAMNPEKDPQFLLKVARKVVDKNPNTRFVFIGGFHDKNYEAQTRGLIKELSLQENAFFLGVKNPVQPYFTHMDILVHPTERKEAFGLVLAEAMFFGKAVVASRIGGIPEIVVDGETGILCEPGNRGEFERGIAKLINDKNLRMQMGRKGKERVVKTFSMNHLSDNIERVFKEVKKG